MICAKQHIMPPGNRNISSFIKRLVVLCLTLLLIQQGALFAQVISNSGAVIQLSNGVVVESTDLDNNAGTLGNDGIINLNGNFLNYFSGITRGSGLYNVRGNWSDFGIFSPDTSMVTFNGATKQIINHGSTGEKFYNLTINNPGNTITQFANPLSSLTVLKNLKIFAGTLALDSTTLNLTVGGKADIDGALFFNNTTTQTTSITDNLSGSGTIDMSGGPHLLNLAGATNTIGTFTTGPSDSSTVDYNGGINQKVFQANNYRNLIISNNGIKTLQGTSSIVGADLAIKGGTFDLGSSAALDVLGTTAVTGTLLFNGNSSKTVLLKGNLSGTGAIDMSGNNRPHLLLLEGSANSIGAYTSTGSESTVDYIRNDKQDVFTSNNYRNLKISGDSVKTLASDISASGILTMLKGNINSNGNTLKITNSDPTAIIHERGTVIGKLQRAIGITGSQYLYPIGSANLYNPLKIKFQDLTSGPLTAQFKPDSIGNLGLPVDDDGDEVWESFKQGYWSLTAVPPMASDNYNVNLSYNGFSGVDSADRVIKRTDGGSLELDGLNDTIDIVQNEIRRKTLWGGISTGSTDFAIGRGRPKIKVQPKDSAICDGLNAIFEVKAKGNNRHVTYQWEVKSITGSDYTNIENLGVYSGATTSKLILTAADFPMNGYYYRVRVTDGRGNFNYSDRALLTVYTNPIAYADSIKPVSCEGKSDGAIYIRVEKGTPIFRYKWLDTDNIPSYEKNLTGDVRYGWPRLTILDAHNCRFDTIFEISKLTPIQIAATSKLYGNYNISCKGASDGEIITSISGGNGPHEDFQYSWENSIGTPLPSDTIIKGLVASTYYFTVIDTFGCVGTAIVKITEPEPIKITRTGEKHAADFDISCYDRSDGIINLKITGGHTASTGVTYTWTMADSAEFSKDTRDINSLTAGKYSLKVKDYFCQKDTSFTLIQPPQLLLDTVSISNFNGKQVSCYSFNDAYMDLSVTGGFGEYKYNWSTVNGLITNPESLDQSDIPAGSYHLDVLDGIDCPASWDFEITQFDTISIAPDLHLSGKNGWGISCFNGADGSIDLNTIGGISPYSWTWSKEGSGITDTAENQNGLTKGSYTVSIKDQNNCLASWNFMLDQPDKLITRIDTTTISCYSTNDGAVDLTVLGGVPDYTYSWSNGSTTQDIESLIIGKYYVDITDANNCPARDSANVTEPADINIELSIPLQYNGRMISCFGASDAIINSVVSGGKIEGRYLYRWMPNDEQTTGISNVPAGWYYLEITDVNRCTKLDSILVEQPLILKTEVYETNPTCFGKTDGQITLIVQGGTPDATLGYDIKWNNGQMGQTADSIGNGVHPVVITDLNGCEMDTVGILFQPQRITLEADPHDPSCPDVFDGSIQYRIDGGTPPYDLELNGLRVDELASDLGEGTYGLKVTDNNRCILTDTSVLKAVSPLCITAPNVFTPNGDGANDTWIIDNIDIYPNVKIEIYNRWGELIYYAPKGYSKPWDGTYKGRQLPIDSYYYILDLNNGKDVLSGNITIIR
jgi:gliding motility-associated-like protein